MRGLASFSLRACRNVVALNQVTCTYSEKQSLWCWCPRSDGEQRIYLRRLKLAFVVGVARLGNETEGHAQKARGFTTPTLPTENLRDLTW